MRFKRSLIISLLVAIVGFAGMLYYQHVFIIERDTSYSYHANLYLPSSNYVRAVSMGNDQAVASYLFMKMIQSFAASWSLPENPREMHNYFKLISDLDRRMTPAYSFAILTIGEAHIPVETVPWPLRHKWVEEVGNKSFVINPGDSTIPGEVGFYTGWTMEDRKKAEYYFRLALRAPNVPEHMNRMLIDLFRSQGLFRQAYEKYLQEYVNGIDREQPYVADIARRNIYRALNQWYVSVITDVAESWHETHGQWPTIEELNAAGAFRGKELPNCALVFQTLDAIADESMALPSHEDISHFVQASVMPVTSLPPGPHELLKPDFPGFIIWPEGKQADDTFVFSGPEYCTVLQKIVQKADSAIYHYIDQQETGLSPLNLNDVAGIIESLPKLPDGGEWVWDPMLLTLYPTTSPEALFVRFPGLDI